MIKITKVTLSNVKMTKKPSKYQNEKIGEHQDFFIVLLLIVL